MGDEYISRNEDFYTVIENEYFNGYFHVYACLTRVVTPVMLKVRSTVENFGHFYEGVM